MWVQQRGASHEISCHCDCVLSDHEWLLGVNHSGSCVFTESVGLTLKGDLEQRYHSSGDHLLHLALLTDPRTLQISEHLGGHQQGR